MKVEHDKCCPLREFVYELGSGKDIPLCECAGDLLALDLIYEATRQHEHKPSSGRLSECSHTDLLWGLRNAVKIIEKQQWQPIETAPRDGTEILGCFGDSREVIYFMNGYFCGGGNAILSEEWEYWMPLSGPPKED